MNIAPKDNERENKNCVWHFISVNRLVFFFEYFILASGGGGDHEISGNESNDD